MPPEFEDPLLAEFIRDSAERIARVGNRKLIADVPKHFRPVAESVARQCAGIWSLELYDGDGFKVSTALQVITIGRGFANQCRRVAEMLTSSSNPELKAIFRKLAANSPAALMSAFAHYFVAHEFVHVEQGLGSDQYQDSDHYMSVVTEADHVADVAGLAIAANAAIPELEALDQRQCILLLVAIHIASMHSFQTAAALDLHAFRRLLSWYLHFARLTKAHECPDLGALGFVRPWVVALPRLIADLDREITCESIAARAANPYLASSDMVIAYHHEDGLFRIHRAALTDPRRVERLATAVVNAQFDDVRAELEELLVNNPALVPRRERRYLGVEWAAGGVVDSLERLADQSAAGATDASLSLLVEEAADEFARFRSTIIIGGHSSKDIETLLDYGDASLAQLRANLDGGVEGASVPAIGAARRRVISAVDQVVLRVLSPN